MTKVNLMVSGMPKNGYTNLQHNVAPQIEYGPLKPVVCDVRQLDTFLDDAECEEIISEYVTDYLPIQEVGPVIARWVAKLRKGGTLILNGTDLQTLSKASTSQAVDTGMLNALLFNPNPPFKKSALKITDVIGILTQMGLKVQRRGFDRYEYSVVAVRE
jgi:predicted SAM-dependent methyltransferase